MEDIVRCTEGVGDGGLEVWYAIVAIINRKSQVIHISDLSGGREGSIAVELVLVGGWRNKDVVQGVGGRVIGD